MGVTVVSSGDRTKLKLRNMARRSENLLPVWPRVGRHLSRAAGKQFETRGVYLGTPWQPLAPSTLRRKRAEGFSSKPLIRSGELRDQYKGRPMQTEIYKPSSALFGSRSDLARWQSGGTRRHMNVVPQPRKGGKFAPYRPGTWYAPTRKHIPARPILPANEMLRLQVKEIIKAYIVGRRAKTP